MVNMREVFSFDRIAEQKCERVPLTDVERSTSLLKAGDLLFARQSLTYAGAGKCVLVLDGSELRTWDSHIMRVRLDRRVADPRFYYYYFRSPTGRRAIETIIQQVAAAGIRGSDLGRLHVPVPSLREQSAIAEVLEALDDKIAANERTIRLANDLTVANFKKAAEGAEFGPETFDDLAQIGGGATPKTSVSDYWGSDVLWATPTDVTGLSAPYLTATARMITEAGLASCSSPLYPAGSILMTSRATIGAFAITQRPMAVNQGFIVVNAKDPDLQWWLFHEMQARVEEFLAHANGATFLELSRGRFKQLMVRRPAAAAAREFADAVRPLHELSAQIVLENAELARTRDEVLPLLISGRLRVKDAETIAKEVN